MTEKNFYKLFLSLDKSDFSFFLCKNCNPPEKGHPLFPNNPPLKLEVLSTNPLFENLVVGLTTPPPPPSPLSRKRGCTHCVFILNE